MGLRYRMLLEKHFKMEYVYEFNFKTEIASFQYPFLLVSSVKFPILDLGNNNSVLTKIIIL